MKFALLASCALLSSTPFLFSSSSAASPPTSSNHYILTQPLVPTPADATAAQSCPKPTGYDANSNQPPPPAALELINGTCNNLHAPNLNAASTAFIRLSPSAYCNFNQVGENITTTPGPYSYAGLSGCDRPQPRLISNLLMAQNRSIIDERGLNELSVHLGQFFNHESHATGNRSCNPFAQNSTCVLEPLLIPVDHTGSLDGAPDSEFDMPIPIFRNAFAAGTGNNITDFNSNPRQEVNAATGWIDGSTTYGNTQKWADIIRSGSGGRLKSQYLWEMQPGQTQRNITEEFPWYASMYTPTEQQTFFNLMNPLHKSAQMMFICGDMRCNEQPGLLASHLIFFREHQYWADQIAAQKRQEAGANYTAAMMTEWDEEIYQRARAIVAAELQKIISQDYWPAYTGIPATPYRGYDETIDARPSIEMVTAAWKLGHSQQPNDMGKRDITTANASDAVIVGASLNDVYFHPEYVVAKPNDLGEIIFGSISRPAEKVDVKLTDGLRNFMFGPCMPKAGTVMSPNAGQQMSSDQLNRMRAAIAAHAQVGMDLAAINIMRGRDYGLADYNTVRVALGLTNHTSWDQITSDVELQQVLSSLYNLGNIDLWIGGLAEDHVENASMGELFFVLFMDSMERQKHGDRNWYEREGTIDATNSTNDVMLRNMVKQTTINDIMLRTVAGLRPDHLNQEDRLGGAFFVRRQPNGQDAPNADDTIDVPYTDDSDAVGSASSTGADGGEQGRGGGAGQSKNGASGKSAAVGAAVVTMVAALLAIVL